MVRGAVLSLLALLVQCHQLYAAEMIGGHIDNKPSTKISTKINPRISTVTTESDLETETESSTFHGYNLPENLFNDGKPFYVEKDPITGAFDFNTKTSLESSKILNHDANDYLSDEPLLRKDNELSNDVTFHDFLNLPVKYTSSKYVYPLISNSYANTKVQGNNNINNHKMYSTTHVTTTKPLYYHMWSSTSKYKQPPPRTTTTTTSTTTTSTTTTTAKPTTTRKPSTTTERVLPSTTRLPSTTTTKKIMSIFDDLFGSDMEYHNYQDSSNEKDDYVDVTSNKDKDKSTVVNDVFGDSSWNQEKAKNQTKPSPVNPDSNLFSPNTHIKPATVYHEDYEDSKNDYDDYDNEPDSILSNTNNKISTTTERRPTITTTNPTVPSKAPTPTVVYTNKHTPAPKLPTSTFKVMPTMTSMQIEKVSSTERNTVKFPSPQPFQSQIDKSQYVNFQVQSPGKINVGHVLPTNNVMIPSNQNTVSFIVHNQQSVDGGQFIGTAIREDPYDQSESYVRPSFQEHAKPLVADFNRVNVINMSRPSIVMHNQAEIQSSPLIGNQPNQRPQFQFNNSRSTTESPVTKPSTITTNNKVVFPASYQTTPPSLPDKPIQFSFDDYDLVPPPRPYLQSPPLDQNEASGVRVNPPKEILQLTGQPMFHQLPKDLTPPSQDDTPQPPKDPSLGPLRQPWDPRPGHFHIGHPEVSKPIRHGVQHDIGLRLPEPDKLPNILPQFRPNAKANPAHYMKKGDGHLPQYHVHQPIDRNPNRPRIDFVDYYQRPPLRKLQPQLETTDSKIDRITTTRRLPKPYPVELSPYENKVTDNRRYSVEQENKRQLPVNSNNSRQPYVYERIISNNNDANVKLQKDNRFPESRLQDEYSTLYQSPPIAPRRQFSNRRNGEISSNGDAVVTLQMIQTKQVPKDISDPTLKPNMPPPFKVNYPAAAPATEIDNRQIYVVYPVNSAPLKLDVISNNEKGGVVVGHRGDNSPLPPSKIHPEINSETNSDYTNTPFTITHQEQKPILILRNKGDSMKTKLKIKSDFPYPLENPSTFETTIEDAAKTQSKIGTSTKPSSSWTSEDSNLLQAYEKQYEQVPEATSERLIAIAYTPTGLPLFTATDDPKLSELKRLENKYSMPNYGNAVISEIRPGVVPSMDNIRPEDVEETDDSHQVAVGSNGSEFTVSAVMHTHPHTMITDRATQNMEFINSHRQDAESGENSDSDSETRVKENYDFQAPFQASVNLGTTSSNEGWFAVTTNNSDKKTEVEEMAADDKIDTEQSDSDNDNDNDNAFENFKPQLYGGFKPIYNLPPISLNSTELELKTPDRLE